LARTFTTSSSRAILSALSSRSTQRSHWIWSYRTGGGDNGVGRLFDAPGGTTLLLNNDNITAYQYSRLFSGGQGDWTIARPSTDAWHSIGISHDASSASNVPVIYVDGASVTVTTAASTSGTVDNTAEAYTIGNRSLDFGRTWSGSIAEFAVWDGILTASDFRALHAGIPPSRVRPDILVEYLPLVRSLASEVIAPATVSSGSPGFADHPRVIRRRPMLWKPSYAAAPGGGFEPAWARNANTVLVGGRLAA
jgi:hypothetical protein